MANLLELTPDFRDFIQCLNANSVDYLLIGGYAVVVHGFQRNTIDIDFWFEATSENCERLTQALKQFGVITFAATELQQPDMVFQMGFPPSRIDLLNTPNPNMRFQDCRQRAEVVQVHDLSVPVISRLDLIQLKSHANRSKDRLDIEMLERIGEKLKGPE